MIQANSYIVLNFNTLLRTVKVKKKERCFGESPEKFFENFEIKGFSFSMIKHLTNKK